MGRKAFKLVKKPCKKYCTEVSYILIMLCKKDCKKVLLNKGNRSGKAFYLQPPQVLQFPEHFAVGFPVAEYICPQ